MDIPKQLIDPTTILKNHTTYTHLFCVILRILISILVFSNILGNKSLIIFSLVIIFIFSNKYFKVFPVWKNYLRTVLIYSNILLINIFKLQNRQHISGILILLDAYLGQQSRYITTNFKYIN